MGFYPADWFDTIRPGFVWWVQQVLASNPSRGGDQWTTALVGTDGDGLRAPMPQRPAAAITVVSPPNPQGRQFVRMEDVSATRADHNVEGAGEGSVQVMLYSQWDERAALAALRASLKRGYPIVDQLTVRGIRIIESLAEESDLSEVFNGEMEFRHVLEAPYRVERRVTTEDYPWIETVNLGNTVVGVS